MSLKAEMYIYNSSELAVTSGIIYTCSGDQNALTALIFGICQDSTLKGFKKNDFRAHTCDFEVREKFC